MAKTAKIYLNPDGQVWRSIPLALDQGLGHVFSALQVDGWILSDHTIIPKSSVHHIDLIEIPDGVQMTVPAGTWVVPPVSQKPN